MQDRAAEREPLPPSAGQVPSQRRLPAAQAGHLEHECPAPREPLPVEPVQAAEERDVLIDRQQFVERKALGHVADPALHPFGVGAHVDPADARGARRGAQQPAQHADGRGLARAVAAEKAEDLPRAHVERHPVDGGERAEPAGQSPDLDGVHRSRPAARRSAASAIRSAAVARVRSSSACSTAISASTHIRAGGDAGLVAFVDDPAGFGRGADAVGRRIDAGPRRLDVEGARLHLEGGLPVHLVEPRGKRARRGGGFPTLGAAAARVPQRPRDRERRVPGGLPAVRARKDAGVRTRQIVAAVHAPPADARPRTTASTRSCAASSRCSSARRSGRGSGAPLSAPTSIAGAADFDRRHGCGGARQALEVGGRASLVRGRFDRQQALPRDAAPPPTAPRAGRSVPASRRARRSRRCASNRSSDRVSTRSVSRAVTSAQNARVTSSTRSARMAARSSPTARPSAAAARSSASARPAV